MIINEFVLTRDILKPTRTLSVVTLNGEKLCYVCEDADLKLELGGIKVPGKTAIPRGRYEIIVTYSNRFNKLLPLLVDVSQFKGIRIHTGNTEVDTDGCLLPGNDRNGNGVYKSKEAFDKWFALIQMADKNYITIQ